MGYQNGQPLLGRAPAGAQRPYLERISRRQGTVPDFAGGRASFAARNTNGTGRYRLVSRDPDVRTVLELNEGHWSESQPDVTEIIYLPITDAATRIAALLSGEVDLIQDVPVQDIARLSNAPGNRPRDRVESGDGFLDRSMCRRLPVR